jgi:putative N6-adenine-specific DNA methylase
MRPKILVVEDDTAIRKLIHMFLEKSGFESWHLSPGKGIVIMNPPYGERMEEDDLQALYKTIGDTLKRNFAGYKAWIFSGNPGAMKYVGLRTSRKLTLFNGPIKCKYHQFELYDGSMKKSHHGKPV